MGYINELLLEDELIEQELEQHWWPLVPPIAGFVLSFLTWIIAGFLVGFIMAISMMIVTLFCLVWLAFVAIDFSTTEYVITSKRLFKKRGWLSLKTAEISRQKVEKVIINQGIFGRALGFGSIQFSGTGAGKLTFAHVLDPVAVKRNIALN